jgi:Tol biopolymer transport system component
VPGADASEGLGGLALSPDGTALYYAQGRSACQSDLVRVPVSGGPAEVVAGGDVPALSPDGRSLAYVEG